MPLSTPRGRHPLVSTRFLHLLTAGLLGLAVMTCSDDHLNGPSGSTHGYFGFRPVTHLSAPPASFGIVIDSVHIRLTRPPSNSVVLDTTAFFPADSSDLKLALLVSLAQQTDTLDALIELKAGGTVVFSATQSIVIVSGPPGSSPLPVVNLAYVGPGKTLAHITIAPRDTAILLGDSVAFSATGVDSSSNPVTSFYVGWKTSDTTLAKVNANGLLRAPAHRGTLKVIGTTPTGIADTTSVTFVPVATTLTKVSGDLQTDSVGRTAPLPIVVQARAADSLGVAGVPVHFSALSGGSVADSLVVTDSLGHAATPISLGTVAGPQKFVARVGALAPDTFTVTAIAGAPAAIAINGGNAQTDTTGLALALPFSVKVTDAFGNATTGAKVAWLRVAGGGALASDTTASDTAGIATAGYTLGALARTDTVSATLAGTSAKVTFTVIAIAAAPAAIVAANGMGQSDTVGRTLAQPFVVFVSDARAHLVAGARVVWTAKFGGGSFSADTVLTDSTGHAQATYTIGTLAGTDTLTATACAGCTATFTVMALAAAPAVIGVQSGNAQVDTIGLALPLPLAAKVTDSHANPVSGVKVYWARAAGAGTVGSDSAFTNAAGVAQSAYTLGTIPGADTIHATIAGTGTFAVFTSLAVAPAPTGIAIGGGNAQADTVGTALPLPLAVTVTGAGSKPVAGTKVAFSIKSGSGNFGGSAVDTVTTDTLGHAQVVFTLGTVAGVDSVLAKSVTGGLTVTFGESAIAAAPSAISIVSGNVQSDTARGTLPLPLVVKVTDAQNNPVNGAKVIWSVPSGTGTYGGLAVDTVATAANGQASVTFTLGTAAGTDTLRAAIEGTAASVTFTATSTSGAATAISIVSGNAQTDTVAGVLPAPLTVRVADGSNNPVTNAKVYWTRTVGTGTVSADSNVTNALGQAQVTFTLGTAVGTDSIKAALQGGTSVVFAATGTAGAAATIAATGGTGQSGSTGTALPNPLTVKVTDTHGNAVPGVTVTWAVTGGGGTLGGVTAITDATGTSTVAQWTLGGTTGTNTATATLAGASGSPVTFAAVSLPLGTTKTWNGTAGTAWATANSWSPAGVPISTDNVYIPSSAPAPSLTANASVGGLSVESGATLSLGAGDTLTALGAVLIPGGASVTGTGAVTLNGTSQQVSGAIANLNVTNTAVLAAATTVSGNVTITGSGSLSINGKPLGVTGSVSLAGSGQLVMTNAADSVDVGGSYTAGGGSSGSNLSAGKLVLRGAFVQSATSSNDFAATGTHTTILAGTSAQSVDFSYPGPTTSHFQNLTVTNPAGISLTSDLAANGTVTLTGGAISGANHAGTIGGGLVDASSARWHVDTTTFSGGGALALPDSMSGIVAFAGAGASLSKAFKLNGTALLIGSGTLAPAGQTLTVTGALAVTQSAELLMTNAADSVDVGGLFTTNSITSSTGGLTAGTLVLRNSFTQTSGSGLNFAASGTHRTVFAGGTAQAALFASPGATSSHFQDVVFADPAGVTFGSDAAVNGTATVASGQVAAPIRALTIGTGLVDAGHGWHPDTTVFTGNSAVLPDSMTGSVHLQGAATLAKSLTILGAAAVDGSGVLTVNGHTFTVTGALSTGGSGVLRMTTAGDSVDVGGAFTTSSAVSSSGQLTTGTLVLRGSFAQIAGSSLNFAPSGTHRTVFAGTAAQGISFSNPATTNSHFQDVTFKNAAGITFGTSVFINGSATLAAGSVTGVNRMAFIGADLIPAVDTLWKVDSTTFTGTPTSLPDSISGAVHFQGTVTLTKPFKVNGAAFLDGSSIFTAGGHPFLVTGPLSTNGGRLVMTNASDSVDVGGAYTVNSVSGVGDLTNGKLVLHGNFTQVANSSNDFAGTLLHQTIFAGSSLQTVTFANPAIANSRFQDLVIDNPAGVNFATAAVAAGNVTVLQGSVTAAGHGIIIGTNLSDASNVSWRPDTTTFNGAATLLPDSIQSVTHFVGSITLAKALKIKGAAFVESSAIFKPSGFPFTVTGAFSVTGNGRLQMTNAADSVDVGGLFSATSGTSSSGDLTQGVLFLRGGLVQGNSSLSFVPSGSHRVRFGGGAAQSITFAYPANSGFNLAEFADPAGVTAASDFSVTSTATVVSGTVTGTGHGATLAGTLQDAGGNGWRMDTTTFTGAPGTLPDSIHGVIHFQAPITLAKAFRVAGALFLDGSNGVLTPNGFPLTVTGALHLAGSGQLKMLATTDSVDVGGMSVATGTSGTGLDTTGVLVMRGGFHQTGGSVTGFAASGSHLTRLVTGSVDSVSFYNPSFTGSHFSNVEVTAGAGTIILGSDVEAIGTITKLPGAAPTLHGKGSLLRSNGLNVDGLVLDSLRLLKSGILQVVRFDSVTFVHVDSTFDQFTLIEGGSASPQTFNHVIFSNPVVFGTGHYLVVADSLGNSQPVTINLNRSTPLYGGSFTSVLAGGDGAVVNWSHLAYAPAPTGGETGLVLPTFRVALVGPLGDTLTDVSDSVTTLIFTNPVGGILSGTTTVATVGGIATFDNVILSGVGNGYVLQSGANGFDPLFSASINIDIQIPAGINAVWRGTVDSLWTNAANWQGGLLPDSASNAFIPVTLHNPYVGISGYVHLNRLVIAAGAGFKADTFSTVQVDSSLDNSAIVTGGGTIQLAKAGTVRGIFNTLNVTGNYAVASGSGLQANRDLTISGVTGRLDLNGTNSSTNGSLTVTNGGLLVMTHAGDTLNVAGDAAFNGGNELGLLTAGRLLLQGNLAQYGSSQIGATPTAFAATAGHVTELLRGSGVQTVHFANPDTTASHLGTLVLSGADSVVLDTLAIALGNVSLTGTNVALQSHDTLAVAGNVTTAAGSRLWLTGLGVAGALNVAGAYHVGTTGFVGAGQSIPALPYDTVRVVGSAALGTDVGVQHFIVGGAAPISQFDLGGHTLSVSGDFVVDTAGRLVMTSALDTIAVTGNFTTDGADSYGSLTNGLIDIGGNFSQATHASVYTAFAATGAHTVRFNGGTHTWAFATGSTGNLGSHFANLLVTGGATLNTGSNTPTFVDGGLTATGSSITDTVFSNGETGRVYYAFSVAGNVNADAASVLHFGDLEVAGTLSAPTAPANYGVITTTFFGAGQSVPALPYQNVVIAGSASTGAALIADNFTIDGSGAPASFDPAGHPLTITSSLGVAPNAVLKMTQASDSVDVGGNANFAGANSNGSLTDGVLVLRGGFAQNGGGNDSAFFATGAHRTVFTAESSPLVGIGYAGTRFNRVAILGSVSIQGGSQPLVVGDSLRLVQGGLSQSGGAHVVALGHFEVDSFATIDVDTLDIHATMHLSNAASYIVGRTRFTGTGQTIVAVTAPLQNVDVIGTASLGGRTFVGDTLTVTGQLDLNGNRLVVDSLFQTLGTGTLKMATAADTLITYNLASFAGGSTAGLLTAGYLETPYFRQLSTNSAQSFAASGSHVLAIVDAPGYSPGPVTFQSSSAATSHPQELAFNLASQRTITNPLYVADTLYGPGSDGNVSGAPGVAVTVVGPFVQSGNPNFSVDTLELRDPDPIRGNIPGLWNPLVTRFAGANQLIRDTIGYHTLEVTGSAHTNYFASADSIIVNGGTLQVGPGNLAANGDFSTRNGGRLTMPVAGANLFINGNATFAGGSTAGLLTAGTISLSSGSFSQADGSGAADAFASSGTAVVMSGSDFVQHVQFQNPGASHFQDFTSTNGLGTVVQGIMPVNGNLDISGTLSGDSVRVQGAASLNAYQAGVYAVTLKDFEVAGGLSTNDTWVVDWTHFTGPTALPALTYNGSVAINAPVIDTSLAPALGIHNLTVAGPGAPFYAGSNGTASLTLVPGVLQTADTVNVRNGDLDAGGGRLLVNTDLNVGTGGTLTMTHPSDTVQVEGNALFGGNSTAGLLTGGTLILRHDLTQSGDAHAFAPSGSHVTAFQGLSYSSGLNHNITFANPATSAFADLREDFPDTLTLQSAVTAGGRLTVTHAVFEPGLLVRGTAQQTLTFGESDVHAAVFDSIPVIFHVADSLIAFDSVSFNAPTDAFTQFSAFGPAGNTITITNPIFTTIGSGTGYYIAATNTSGSGTFTVQAFQANVGQLEFNAHVLGDVFSLISWLLPG